MNINRLKYAVAATALLFPLTACAQEAATEATLAAAVAGPQTYTIDAAHTAVTFHIDHFGFSTPSGKFMNIEGEIVIDEADPAQSSVSVTIPVAMVDTGVPALDEHLVTADFFNTQEFPTATFASTSVELTGETTAKVTGDLTLHGVTRPVTLDVTLNKIGKNIFDKQTAGFSATTTIQRSDFGVTTYLPGLGDEVVLEIESEANL